MKQFKLFLAFAIVSIGQTLFAQGPSFYDLVFQADSVKSPYKTSNSNHAYVRSKRGTEGLNPTSSADSVKTFTISKIVLVFTESSSEDIANREEYNQERWENLIMTYPEFFQAKTVYQNMCQCTENGGADDYKTAQGFYIYFTPKGGIAAPPKKAEPVAVKTEAPVAEAPKKVAHVEEPAKKQETPVTKTEEPVAKTEPVKEEPKREEPKKVVVKEPEAPTVETKEESSTPVAETATKKKAGAMKPRRSKDPKACRPACYGYGDDDLNAFFKDNIKLTKKQKKKWKSASSDLKLQLNIDGSIKKSMVAGANADLNKLVLEAAQSMNAWNATVKNGVTIKSEVRITLKFDKETKSFKPFEVNVNPKPNPKCKCASDSEIFGE